MAEMIDRKLFSEAKRYIPGGVNSPARSFKAVGGVPVFIRRAKGPYLYGEDGRRYIDYCLSWGALILGHAQKEVVSGIKQAAEDGSSFGAATKLETELAKLIVEAAPSIEQARLTNSGTEAVMAAARLARAYTGRDKIIKFSGSYHGHSDYLLSQRSGVPADFTRHTLVLPYNNIAEVKKAADKYKGKLAAIIVEPVEANCGVILPAQGFLRGLRRVADRYNLVLIFDEVITGFRLSYAGAQGYFGVMPDLTCLGKIVGGGLPVGAFGGRRKIMKLLAPEGVVYQAGTLSGNPVAVTAGITTLRHLKRYNPYRQLADKAEALCAGIEDIAGRYNVKLKVNHIGSMFSIFFANAGLFRRFFHGLLKEGIYFSPSMFEADFLSTAHSPKDIEKTLDAANKILKNLK